MSEVFLNVDNFDSEVNSADKVVLVDFFAIWCGPCKMLAPVLEDVANTYGERLKVCKVNVDEEPELARNYSIVSIPTMMFFKYGKVVKSVVGLISKSELVEIIEDLL